jgi:hypothetical protein
MLKAGTAARRRSIHRRAPLAASDIRAGIEHFLHLIDRRLQELDPTWVGHCKLLVASEHGTAYASLTQANESPRWAGEPMDSGMAELTIYVAIYGWNDAEVAEALDSTLAAEPLFDQPDLMPR